MDRASLVPEIAAATLRGDLPSYAPRLASFHGACANALRGLVRELPLGTGDRVLDLACGDGAYSVWLAEQVGPSGRVVASDLNPAFLELTRERAERHRVGERVEAVRADVRSLPFASGEFDAAWCAHSLQSLPDPDHALGELTRVVRGGGVVAVLENDSLHYLMLPLSPELELAVQEAQLAIARAQHVRRKVYIGRRLHGVLAKAGLGEIRIQTASVDHRAPLDADERAFLSDYLRELAERTRDWLDPAMRDELERVLSPESPDYLLDRPDFFTTHLEILAWGRKPS